MKSFAPGFWNALLSCAREVRKTERISWSRGSSDRKCANCRDMEVSARLRLFPFSRDFFVLPLISRGLISFLSYMFTSSVSFILTITSLCNLPLIFFSLSCIFCVIFSVSLILISVCFFMSPYSFLVIRPLPVLLLSLYWFS